MAMLDFFKKFEDAMASAAFAEAGEFDSARQMMGQDKNSNKKVLLGTEGTDVDNKAFHYALNLCRRVGAKLEILHILRPSAVEPQQGLEEVLSEAKESLGPALARLRESGIEYILNFGEGRLEKEVASYADGRRDILFVVVEAPSTGGKKRSGLEKRISDALSGLGCPLIVVSDAK